MLGGVLAKNIGWPLGAWRTLAFMGLPTPLSTDEDTEQMDDSEQCLLFASSKANRVKKVTCSQSVQIFRVCHSLGILTGIGPHKSLPWENCVCQWKTSDGRPIKDNSYVWHKESKWGWKTKGHSPCTFIYLSLKCSQWYHQALSTQKYHGEAQMKWARKKARWMIPCTLTSPV